MTVSAPSRPISTGHLYFSAPAEKIERCVKRICLGIVQEKFGSQEGRFSTSEDGLLENICSIGVITEGVSPSG